MRSISLFAACLGLSLAGCAGPLLNHNTMTLGPSLGTLEEKQVLINLGRFIDNDWAIPGHVELSAGQVQVSNQIGINLKYPHTYGVSGASLTKSATEEFDLTPAQTMDQESYSIVPVTNSSDVQRLRALYHLAVCPDDVESFDHDWRIADQAAFAADVDARDRRKQMSAQAISKRQNEQKQREANQKTEEVKLQARNDAAVATKAIRLTKGASEAIKNDTSEIDAAFANLEKKPQPGERPRSARKD